MDNIRVSKIEWKRIESERARAKAMILFYGKQKKKVGPFWDEDGSLMSLLFGRNSNGHQQPTCNGSSSTCNFILLCKYQVHYDTRSAVLVCIYVSLIHTNYMFLYAPSIHIHSNTLALAYLNDGLAGWHDAWTNCFTFTDFGAL